MRAKGLLGFALSVVMLTSGMARADSILVTYDLEGSDFIVTSPIPGIPVAVTGTMQMRYSGTGLDIEDGDTLLVSFDAGIVLDGSGGTGLTGSLGFALTTPVPGTLSGSVLASSSAAEFNTTGTVFCAPGLPCQALGLPLVNVVDRTDTVPLDPGVLAPINPISAFQLNQPFVVPFEFGGLDLPLIGTVNIRATELRREPIVEPVIPEPGAVTLFGVGALLLGLARRSPRQRPPPSA
jgi:hypothetical protein